MAHVSATIPWEEGKEEDFKELREELEKLRAGEDLAKDSSDSDSEDNADCGKLVEYKKYEDSDSENVDDPDEEEDPGEDKPGERLLWAAQHNQLPLATSLVSSCPGLVLSRDADLYTPLHRAAYGDHRAMLLLLLGGGADPLAATADG